MSFIGFVYKTEVLSNKTKDEFWKVDIVISEKRTSDGVEWKEEVIEASSVDLNREDAERVALRSALAQLDDLVYSRGYKSLIDAREDENESNSQDNEDTTS